MSPQIPRADVSQLAAIIQHGDVWSDIRDVGTERAKVRVMCDVSAYNSQRKEVTVMTVRDLRGVVKISGTLIEEELRHLQWHVRIGILRDPDGRHILIRSLHPTDVVWQIREIAIPMQRQEIRRTPSIAVRIKCCKPVRSTRCTSHCRCP